MEAIPDVYSNLKGVENCVSRMSNICQNQWSRQTLEISKLLWSPVIENSHHSIWSPPYGRLQVTTHHKHQQWYLFSLTYDGLILLIWVIMDSPCGQNQTKDNSKFLNKGKREMNEIMKGKEDCARYSTEEDRPPCQYSHRKEIEFANVKKKMHQHLLEHARWMHCSERGPLIILTGKTIYTLPVVSMIDGWWSSRKIRVLGVWLWKNGVRIFKSVHGYLDDFK